MFCLSDFLDGKSMPLGMNGSERQKSLAVLKERRMTTADLRGRVSVSVKMVGNHQVTCPRCGTPMKRKRMVNHHCVRQGTVKIQNGTLVIAGT